MSGIPSKKKVLLGSLVVSIIILTLTTIITQDTATIMNIGVLCIFILVTPSFLYRYGEFLSIKSMEKEFPNFLRDLSNLKRSGMTLSESVKLATKTKYGSLTPHVKTLSNKLSWGIPFLRSLEIFGEGLKGSRIITEAIDIIKASYKSGGDMTSILDSLAVDMRIIKDAEEEKKSLVSQHVMIMYGIFFLFMGISVVIIYVLVPMMTSSAPQGGVESPMMLSFSSPCENMYMPFPCGLFNLMCTSFNVPKGVGCYYFSLFLTILIIQAIFTGMIAGQLGENSALAGIKHSLIMLAVVFVVFVFLTKLNLLPI